MVHHVTSHHRMLATRADIDAAVTRRMARSRRQRERVVELKGVVDQERLASFDNRQAIKGPYILGAADQYICADHRLKLSRL
jgi:hypothetical protein